MDLCANCGEAVTTSGRFCSHCGKSFDQPRPATDDRRHDTEPDVGRPEETSKVRWPLSGSGGAGNGADAKEGLPGGSTAWLGAIIIVIVLVLVSIYVRVSSGKGVVGTWYGEFQDGDGENLSVTFYIQEGNSFHILVESDSREPYDSTEDADDNWVGKWEKIDSPGFVSPLSDRDSEYEFTFQANETDAGVIKATFDKDDDRLIFPDIEGGRLELERID